MGNYSDMEIMAQDLERQSEGKKLKAWEWLENKGTLQFSYNTCYAKRKYEKMLH